MIKRLTLGFAMALVCLLIAVPVLAAYYATITVQESSGVSYTELPIICDANMTQLIDYGTMTSTGLDTRVLTGDGYALPHALANDKILFVSDLAAHETKTLTFYMGATSLSSFPIIVGYNGSFETPDDPDLELGYVMELLISGSFDASGDTEGPILYKEDAFKVWISSANTLRVAALNSTGDEQWEMHYGNFTTGYHMVYIVCNGLFALLYVDAFDVAVDTTSLYTNVNWQLASQTDTNLRPMTRRTIYAVGRYWAFWLEQSVSDHIYYSSSTDGTAWETIADIDVSNVTSTNRIAIAFDGTYVHIGVMCTAYTGAAYYPILYYFRGELVGDGTINWDAQDVVVALATDQSLYGFSINVDSNGYPFVIYSTKKPTYPGFYGSVVALKSSTNDGTWTTAGGYPQNLDYDTTSPYYDTQRYCYLAEYHNTTHLYALYSDDGHHNSSTTYTLMGNYFNGMSWSGSPDTIFDGYLTSEVVQYFDAVCDDDGNMFVIWSTLADNVYMRVRYADTSWGGITLVVTSAKQPSVSYSPASHCVYVVFISGNYVYGVSIVGGAVSHSGVIFTPVTTTGATMCNSGYSTYSGILYCTSGQIQHAMIGFYWLWNDNDEDWIWMADSIMPYADECLLAVDGIIQLDYKPATIIQGDILPDVGPGGEHDATIFWGANPSGIDVSISAIQNTNNPGYNSTPSSIIIVPPSIIHPVSPPLTNDVNLAKLQNNPLYPLIHALSNASSGLLPERLIWLGGAWLLVFLAMGVTFFGFRARRRNANELQNTPQNMLFAGVVGFGLTCMFYAMFIFPWYAVGLMALGVIANVIWERAYI
jgi:hypothetical protein